VFEIKIYGRDFIYCYAVVNRVSFFYVCISEPILTVPVSTQMYNTRLYFLKGKIATGFLW